MGLWWGLLRYCNLGGGVWGGGGGGGATRVSEDFMRFVRAFRPGCKGSS